MLQVKHRKNVTFNLKTSKKGQVVIPKPIRDELGDNFIIQYNQDSKKWELLGIREIVDGLCGMVQGGPTAQEIKNEIRTEEKLRNKIKFDL